MNDLLMSSPDKIESGNRERNGFRNMGQSCYLNVVLQMLFNTSLFKSHLLRLTPDEVESTTILKEMSNLFKEKSEESIVEPRSLKTAVGSVSSRFAGSQQEDAHEFLQALFALLDEDYAKVELKHGVRDVFEWTLENRVCCDSCGHVSVREDSCRDISVDFPAMDPENAL